MSERHNLEYYHIAQVQVDKAIELYKMETIEGHICSITLAGAAEEILGKLIEREGRESAFQNLISNLSEQFEGFRKKEIITISNFIRDSFKHFKEEFCAYDVDLELHARVMVMRAVANYCTLTNKKTELMAEFLDIFEERTGVK